ncbi:MAG: 3-demethylubiquinone-9 3-methyltransferase [Burkholderiales bacterium]|jgi:PhnB protein|nr:3-demethylubiquinone-9 3-methyltransferase [Burkholderiales bacterium]
MQLNSYLSFGGNCEEALKLYSEAFGGKIEYKMLYSDNKDMCKNLPENWQNKIMHASFRAGDIFIMASDVLVGENSSCGTVQLVPEGSPITLSLNFDSEAEETEVFNKLAQGGKVTMPLQDTFWGAHFGMLTDKFGIKWMFNFDKSNNK